VVKDTGKASSSGYIRSLNQPIDVSVKIDETGSPLVIKLRGRWLKVEFVDDRWRIDDEWWRDEPVSRNYFSCVVDEGIKVAVFQNLGTKQWYRQRM
jgi:hypothetical protein